MGRTCCAQKLFLSFRTISVHNMFSPCSAKKKASDKNLPVLFYFHDCVFLLLHAYVIYCEFVIQGLGRKLEKLMIATK